MPGTKTLSGDGFRIAELQRAPDIFFEALARVFAKIEAALVWPLQMLLVVMSLIPKPTGGSRTIAKTPILYRLWCVARRQGVPNWEHDIRADFDNSVPGLSALRAALRRTVLLEISGYSGQAAALVLWDWAKLCDTIPPRDVLSSAESLGYPNADLALSLSMHGAPRALQSNNCIAKPQPAKRSILAGCTHSVPFTRALLKKKFQALGLQIPGVMQGVFIDDVPEVALWVSGAWHFSL